MEVRPGAAAEVEILAERLPTITGQVVDAVTGKGLAGVPVHCYRLDDQWYKKDPRDTKTDGDGRYSIAAAPGVVKILPVGLPQANLVPRFSETPDLPLTADRTWPDLKLAQAVEVDGIVVDENGQPVVGAEVYILDGGPLKQDEVHRTGPGGTFHLSQLDPDDTLSLWARTMVATTDGRVTVRPGHITGNLTLTVDPKFACQIRGVVTDVNGNRIPGANVKLWWGRPYTSQTNNSARLAVAILHSYVTNENGWFVFRGLCPGCEYGAEVMALGHHKAAAFSIVGQSGEIHDVGKIALFNTGARLVGRVVGSDGRPVSGAVVFNRGDGKKTAATSTDSRGLFQLESLSPGTKFAFISKDGYRFTGVKIADDTERIAVTIKKTTEPPPPWNPTATASFEQQRAFAKQILIRVWEKRGPNASAKTAIECIQAMAPIDLPLALKWSANGGHQRDSRVRLITAEGLAETDPRGTVALLAKDRDRFAQAFFQKLAQRCANTDRPNALLFADQAVVRARELEENARAAALAATGPVFAAIGRPDVGRALFDEAARVAMQLDTEGPGAQARASVAGGLADVDLKRALALVDPITAEDMDPYFAFIARAIATTDTRRAVALADEMNGPTPAHERVKTAIAYKIGADRPDEAITIIEGITRGHAGRWQAEAFGWLAVALAPRDRTRAFALIDRALAMMTEDSVAAVSRTHFGDEMMAAAHIAARARQIGYPDMESVIMRVLAARPGDWAPDSRTQIRFTTFAAISLALLDPDPARTVLEQIDAHFGSGELNPATLPNGRHPWLTAWALVDLEKAKTLFEAELAALQENEGTDLVVRGLLNAVEILATPPACREAALKNGLYGQSWRP